MIENGSSPCSTSAIGGENKEKKRRENREMRS